jgi:hypothetical protein
VHRHIPRVARANRQCGVAGQADPADGRPERAGTNYPGRGSVPRRSAPERPVLVADQELLDR